MSRVYLAQALCPQRHCIVANAFEAEDAIDPDLACAYLAELLQKEIDAAIEKKAINPWCELCGARRVDWRFEGARTKYRTMEEARPNLEREEAEQRRSREWIKAEQRKAMNN